jgi:CRISPR-associated protein Cas1
MLNEFTYCPRLSYLEWAQGDFADSVDTVDGRFQHRRVDKESGDLLAPDNIAGEKLHARSVRLSAPKVGLIARIDLVEAGGATVTPVDYKRGEAPDLPEGAWEPERVQLCAYGLVLEENGYTCCEGVLYFVESKKRITISFTPELRARTIELLAAMRTTKTIPPPLQDSPKCPRCSLVGICLPDETNLLRGISTEPRRLVPALADELPLYVQSPGTRVGKSGDELTVQPLEGEKRSVRLGQTSQVALFGPVQMSTQALQATLGQQIPISYFTTGGWFYGITTGLPHKNVELRRLQFRAADDKAVSLALAKQFVAAKISNSRVLLRRNATNVDTALDAMKAATDVVSAAVSIESLLGIEGAAARAYFQSFARMLKGAHEFDFDGRNRRPPRDPVNALLSLVYALLAKDVTVTALMVGFDPLLGFYHQPKYGRPALALDLMEEFRPIIADSAVLSAINTNVVRTGDFVCRNNAVALTEPARIRFIQLYERRLDELVTHPVFGYRISYRRVLEVQARLLARFLGGEIPEYPGFQTR